VLHQELINQHFENCNKSSHSPVLVHPLLAKMSKYVYKEVVKIMVFPDIIRV
jgi:hypothetical protein